MNKERNDLQNFKNTPEKCRDIILSIQFHVIQRILKSIGSSKVGCLNDRKHVLESNAIAIIDETTVFNVIQFGHFFE